MRAATFASGGPLHLSLSRTVQAARFANSSAMSLRVASSVSRPEASKTLQVGFLAMNRAGEVGAYAIQRGFSYAVCDAKKQDGLIPSQSVYTTNYS